MEEVIWMIKGWANDDKNNGTACGASDDQKPTACGTACGAGDNK